MASAAPPVNGTAIAVQHLHATALVVGECGVLIEGPAGSGKSSLAAALLRQAALRGWFARLVGDDRVQLDVVGARLMVRPHPAIAGLLERRGVGLIPVEHERACVVHLVVHILPATDGMPPRLPDMPPRRCLAGVDLPLVMLPGSLATEDQAGRVAAAIAGLL